MSPFFKQVFRILREEKKWWLVPMIVAIVLLAVVVYLAQGPAPLSPFMYSVK